jgi:hypothetical protein
MTDISIEGAVRQTLDALGIEDDEDRIESAMTEIMVLASSFGHQRDYCAGWEEQFAGMYIRPLGALGQMALLAEWDIDDFPSPDRRFFRDGEDLIPSEIVYAAAQTWLTLIVKNVFVRLGH